MSLDAALNKLHPINQTQHTAVKTLSVESKPYEKGNLTDETLLHQIISS
jgi:hypothetical protein